MIYVLRRISQVELNLCRLVVQICGVGKQCLLCKHDSQIWKSTQNFIQLVRFETLFIGQAISVS